MERVVRLALVTEVLEDLAYGATRRVEASRRLAAEALSLPSVPPQSHRGALMVEVEDVVSATRDVLTVAGRSQLRSRLRALVEIATARRVTRTWVKATAAEALAAREVERE